MDLMRAVKYIEDDVVEQGVSRGLVYERNSFVLLCLLSAQNTG